MPCDTSPRVRRHKRFAEQNLGAGRIYFARLRIKSNRAEPPTAAKSKKKDTLSRVFLFSGAGDEARTRYLDLGKVALYQMSYARKRKIDYIAYFCVCQPCILEIFILP